MFNHAVADRPLPKHVSTDHDSLFRFHRWLANLRILEIEEIKSVPRPDLASVRRTPDRHRPPRISRLRVLLKRSRPEA